MRVALISDLHGNEIALRAVLADAARVGVDRVEIAIETEVAEATEDQTA